MRVRIAAATAALLICAVSLSSQATPYDVLIRNGRVLDGSGQRGKFCERRGCADTIS